MQCFKLSSFVLNTALVVPVGVSSQTGKFEDTFQQDKGWALSKITVPDSLDFTAKNGSLITKNRSSKSAIVQYKFYGTGVLSTRKTR